MNHIGHHFSTWWNALTRPDRAGELVMRRVDAPGLDRFLLSLIIVLYAVYGVSMGVYRGGFPAAVSGLKLPFLYVLTLAICFPCFYVLNGLLGSRLDARHCLRLLLLATSANAVALASYAPVSFFFAFTTSTSSSTGYPFLVLMHVIVFAVAGLSSILVIVLVFRATAAVRGTRVRSAFLASYACLYALVGSQMSWVLRPWIGAWTVTYHPFRPLGGSFAESVWRLIQTTW